MITKTYLNDDQTTLIRWNPVCVLDIATIVSTRILSRIEFIYVCSSHNILQTLFKVEVNTVYKKGFSLLIITYGINSIQIVLANTKDGLSVFNDNKLNNIPTREEI